MHNMQKRLFLAAIAILCTTFVAHVYAHVDDLYWNIWWLDILMHFFGGVGVGFLGLGCAVLCGFLPKAGRQAFVGSITVNFKSGTPPWWWSAGCALIAVAIVGLAWEVLEVFLLAYSGKQIPVGYIADTMLDLVMDAAGATVAWACFYRVQYGAWGVREKFPANNQSTQQS